MLALGFVGWIVIGGLAGWIASKIKGNDAEQGILMNIVMGVLGGVLGGYVLKFFGVDVANKGMIFSFVTCLIGAVVVISIKQYSRRGSITPGQGSNYCSPFSISPVSSQC